MDAETFRQKFEAHVRSHCPADHPDPESFLWYDQKGPGVDRDGNFSDSCGWVVMTIYRQGDAKNPSDATIETCLVAHEFGHFRSWEQQSDEQRALLRRICLMSYSPTELEKDLIYEEEEDAWEFARRELEAQRFEAWYVFDECRQAGLSNYLRRLGRAGSRH